MKRLLSWLGTTTLLAIVTAGAQPAGRPPAGSRPLANGVYSVLREGLTRAEVQAEARPHIVLVYDRKYSDSDKDKPPKYVALDTSSFVPLVLSGPPQTRMDGDRMLLSVTLAPQYVKTLEEFTRAHLNGVVAIVIDGEIVTMHKVRAVIQDGKAQITRCTDDACKTLKLKLSK